MKPADKGSAVVVMDKTTLVCRSIHSYLVAVQYLKFPINKSFEIYTQDQEEQDKSPPIMMKSKMVFFLYIFLY